MAEACLLCAASNRSSWCTLPPTIGDAAGDQFSIVFGVSLPTADDAIAVDGIELAEVAPPARLVGGDHGRAAPAEEVEDDTAALGNILDRICNHLNRLDCRMQRQFIHPAAAKRVDALVGPYVGSIAPVLAKFEAVDVRRGPLFEGEDQFVPGAIEGAHSAVILDPDNQVLELAEHVVGCRQHLARRQSMHMRCIEPSTLASASRWNVVRRNVVNSGEVISPEAMANSRCLIAPLPPTWP